MKFLAVRSQLTIERIDRTKEFAHFDLALGDVLFNKALDHKVWLFSPINPCFCHQMHCFAVDIFKNPAENKISDLTKKFLEDCKPSKKSLHLLNVESFRIRKIVSFDCHFYYYSARWIYQHVMNLFLISMVRANHARHFDCIAFLHVDVICGKMCQ